ncbi:copper homeostasis membrane protein CopD [Sphingomonas sp.]|uniref:copper homeostasis membrane protein CopD n=1 Tax=Sphingomonas sp. TaxID=28214 RepID=UPI003D6CFADB
MDDWPIIAVRYGLFVDLGLLFGMALFGLYGMRGADRDGRTSIPIRPLLLALASVGAMLSGFGFGLQAAGMAGTSFTDVDQATLIMLLSGTALGWALLTRLVALSGVLICAPAIARRPVAALLPASLLSGVAVATLAWSGHGAATEGMAGWIHLLSDILHLLAAAAWLGALFVLLLLVMRDRATADIEQVRATRHALAGFSTMGTIIVALLVATGLVNGAFLVGADHIQTLPATPYGQLLIAKLILFGAMLGLAALNRFCLTPALEVALDQSTPQVALALLRRSLAVEAGLALLIFGLVAWLGTLAPPVAGI